MVWTKSPNCFGVLHLILYCFVFFFSRLDSVCYDFFFMLFYYLYYENNLSYHTHDTPTCQFVVPFHFNLRDYLILVSGHVLIKYFCFFFYFFFKKFSRHTFFLKFSPVAHFKFFFFSSKNFDLRLDFFSFFNTFPARFQ